MRRGQKGTEVVGAAVVPDGQSVITEQPGDRSFDHPAVFAQFRAGLDAFAGDPYGHAVITNPDTEIGLVVGLVGVQLGRSTTAWAAPERIGGIAMTRGLRA
jgi:hypothetical protein